MQHVEAARALRRAAECLDGLSGKSDDREAVKARESARADDHQGPLRRPQFLGEAMPPGDEVGERLRTGAEIVVRIGEIGALADHPDGQRCGAPALADARVDERGLDPRIGADHQDGVGALDAGDGAVEEIGGAAEIGVKRRAVLAAIHARDAEAAA